MKYEKQTALHLVENIENFTENLLQVTNKAYRSIQNAQGGWRDRQFKAFCDNWKEVIQGIKAASNTVESYKNQYRKKIEELDAPE